MASNGKTLKIFCFQGVEKGCIWNKWFKELLEPKQSLNRAQDDDWYDAKNFLVQQFVGNKAKRRISKRQVTRKQITPNFPKKWIFLTPRGVKKCSFFRKTWRALFSCYPRFEIRLFASLPTNYWRPWYFLTLWRPWSFQNLTFFCKKMFNFQTSASPELRWFRP